MRARVRTLAALVSAKPMYQNWDARAPRNPASSDERHSLRLPRRAARLKTASHRSSSTVWTARPQTSVVVARTANEVDGTARVAPRKLVAASAKKAPAAMPSITGRALNIDAGAPPGFRDVTSTPNVAITMAVAITKVRGSP